MNPVVKIHPPTHVEAALKRAEEGMIPMEFNMWHLELAVERLSELIQTDGLTLVHQWVAPSGWFDGGRYLQATVITRTMRRVSLKWEPFNQDFMVDTGHGHVCLFQKDLK